METPKSMVRRNKSSYQSPVKVVGGSSSLEREIIVVVGPGRGSSRNNFLAKREC